MDDILKLAPMFEEPLAVLVWTLTPAASIWVLWCLWGWFRIFALRDVRQQRRIAQNAVETIRFLREQLLNPPEHPADGFYRVIQGGDWLQKNGLYPHQMRQADERTRVSHLFWLEGLIETRGFENACRYMLPPAAMTGRMRRVTRRGGSRSWWRKLVDEVGEREVQRLQEENDASVIKEIIREPVPDYSRIPRVSFEDRQRIKESRLSRFFDSDAGSWEVWLRSLPAEQADALLQALTHPQRPDEDDPHRTSPSARQPLEGTGRAAP